RLEIEDANGKTILSALLPRGTGTYRAPSWLRERAPGVLRWRVIALDDAGKELSESEWRTLRFAEPISVDKPTP
ncbi:MAG: hypothetical protein M3362_17320, partial [Acidobacteriota bacterium]|nr:hypothetical protein [Acidobacteriota bacterium]